jgi:predicted nucleotide-binding protein (sugar kinase/HSP70/actin superfamily)
MVKTVAQEIREMGDRLSALYDEPVAVDEAGGYYTQPVYDLIEEHGIEKVMHELLTFLDFNQIEDFIKNTNFQD